MDDIFIRFRSINWNKLDSWLGNHIWIFLNYGKVLLNMVRKKIPKKMEMKVRRYTSF